MGYVYLICDPEANRFKIGVTRENIKERIKKLQTGNSTELFISSYYESRFPFRLEKMLHNKFKEKKELNEWFNLENKDIFNFKKICEQQEELINLLLTNPFFSKGIR